MEPELLIPEPHKAIIKRKKKNREKTLKIKNNTWRKANSVNIAENMERVARGLTLTIPPKYKSPFSVS